MAHLYDVFLSMKEVRGCVELEREKGEDVKSIIRTFEHVKGLIAGFFLNYTGIHRFNIPDA